MKKYILFFIFLFLCAETAFVQAAAKDSFVLVEGGCFQMGSENGNLNEKPVHTVSVPDFYMCVHEVTQDEYYSITKENPSYFEGKNYPVESVSWYDAVEYCNWLSLEEGLTPCYKCKKNGDYICDFNANGYRLPTEAEWEYAARGGKSSSQDTIYSGNNDINRAAWYDENSDNKIHTVETKEPNALGLYDMSGNVWEWCWDRYGAYSSKTKQNHKDIVSGDCHVLRGGSACNDAYNCRVYSREGANPGYNYSNFIGFRVVRTAKKTR